MQPIWLADVKQQLRVLFIFGTRPEVIKLAPVIEKLKEYPFLQVLLCSTGQHRELLEQAFTLFRLQPDYNLNVMLPGQQLASTGARILLGLERVLSHCQPHLVIVQGDTTSTFCGALAAFYARIPVAHIEAGLRTGDPNEPFPEEINRILTGRLATLHFAPTPQAAANLLAEGVPASRIHVTGNPVVDAVLSVARRLCAGYLTGFPWHRYRRDPSKALLLVTTHRRENFGPRLLHICRAVRELAQKHPVEIYFPVHPNPNVQKTVTGELAGLPNLHLLPPLSYAEFIDLMQHAYFILSDSGGVQEEAPSLGKPVLVLRDKTERMEAVEAGVVKLVGTDPERIVDEAEKLLTDQSLYDAMSQAKNPFGDGQASQRIASVILSFLGTYASDLPLHLSQPRSLAAGLHS